MLYGPWKPYGLPRCSGSSRPLTPREEALIAPQRPRQAISTVVQGAAMPPHGIDPSVPAMDESLLDVVLRRRSRPNHC